MSCKTPPTGRAKPWRFSVSCRRSSIPLFPVPRRHHGLTHGLHCLRCYLRLPPPQSSPGPPSPSPSPSPTLSAGCLLLYGHSFVNISPHATSRASLNNQPSTSSSFPSTSFILPRWFYYRLYHSRHSSSSLYNN